MSEKDDVGPVMTRATTAIKMFGTSRIDHLYRDPHAFVAALLISPTLSTYEFTQIQTVFSH